MAGRTHDHHARVDPHPELLAPIADDTLDVEDLLHAVPEADKPLGLRTDRDVALVPDLPDVRETDPHCAGVNVGLVRAFSNWQTVPSIRGLSAHSGRIERVRSSRSVRD